MLRKRVSKFNRESSESVLGSAHGKSTSAPNEVYALDTTLRVKTPENISFKYQLAGPFRRIFAYFFDVVISLGAFYFICLIIYVGFLFVILPVAAYFGGGQVISQLMGILGGIREIVFFIVYWFYGAYWEACFNGQTIGKRMTKMRVITTEGHAIDGVQATLRNFFRLLDVMPLLPVSAIFAIEPTDSQLDQLLNAPLFPTCLFGLVVMTLSPKFQRLGDLVAGTVVVSEELNRRPNLATFDDARVPKLAELIPTSFVVPASMARSIADYVDQRKYLPFQRASEIASHLAVPLIKKFNIPHDTDCDLFLCALYYKTYAASKLQEGPVSPLVGQTSAHLNQQETAQASSSLTDSGSQMDPPELRIKT